MIGVATGIPEKVSPPLFNPSLFHALMETASAAPPAGSGLEVGPSSDRAGNSLIRLTAALTENARAAWRMFEA
jgi:hypothetical protein